MPSRGFGRVLLAKSWSSLDLHVTGKHLSWCLSGILHRVHKFVVSLIVGLHCGAQYSGVVAPSA
jgi:hypothetical protein